MFQLGFFVERNDILLADNVAVELVPAYRK